MRTSYELRNLTIWVKEKDEKERQGGKRDMIDCAA